MSDLSFLKQGCQQQQNAKINGVMCKSVAVGMLVWKNLSGGGIGGALNW